MALPLKSFQNIYFKICSSRILNISMRNSLSRLKYKDISKRCFSFNCYEDKDPAPLFFDTQVQETLKRLTVLNIEKIFKDRHIENPNSNEEYKFLTEEDLEENISKSMIEAGRLLQMPPVLATRKPIKEMLSYDPAIQGALKSKIVFADISFGVSDRERIIVVRDTDGTLRQAEWEERDRINHIYNPRPGRYHRVPQLFEDENLKDALGREEYLFVLDFACAQFEPDDPLFLKVTQKTYEAVRENGHFSVLHSTRHYGPMCFYLAWNNLIDSLLLSYIHEERIEEAEDLVALFYLIHDKEMAPKQRLEKQQRLDFIKKYINEDSQLRGNLELAYQSYVEIMKEKEKFESTVKTSHGIS